MNSRFAKDGRRMLALWFPHLPAERILRQRLGRSWRSRPPGGSRAALVISHRDTNAQRIAALDEQAEALGLKPGMGVADARAMHPSIEVVEADAQADRRLLEGLADWCDRYTPLVAVDGGDGLFLDISGCAHLFGGERAMLDDLMARLFHQGFDVRAGLASTPGAAWAAARFGLSPIGPGEEEEALAPLPLSALRLEPAVRAGLEQNVYGLEHVKEAIVSALAQQSALFSRYLGVLATVGSTAPFIGLFGTVLGILRAFNKIAQQGFSGPSVVAGGIAEALMATAFGLGVAIPAVIAYNIFVGKVSDLTLVVSGHASQLLPLVAERETVDAGT